MVRRRYWGEKKKQETIGRKGEERRKKKRKEQKEKKESNAKIKIGERIKGKSADGGDKTEKMNGWAEGRQRKGKAE